MKENKETQRQLFGMVWLLNSCDLAPTAVSPEIEYMPDMCKCVLTTI